VLNAIKPRKFKPRSQAEHWS